MADPEHVALAKSGANAIAQWRELTYMIPNPTVTMYTLTYELGNRSAGETFEKQFVYGRAKLDLSGASLSGVKLARADLAHDNLSRVDLTGCNLRLADLQGANLQSAHLSRSDLSNAICISTNMIGCSLVRTNLSNSALQSAGLRGADLSYSNLSYTNLEGANLSETNLSFADLSWANLSGANLRGANLTAATLKLADLTGADLRGAVITKADLDSTIFLNAVLGITEFVNCDLSKVIGLDLARHTGPSTIGLDTLARSGGAIPKAFLENAGVAAPLIAAQDALNGVKRAYPSVLIIGSAGDSEFAQRIRSGLAASQIPSWAIAADDEAAVQSGDILLDHTIYYDRLVLLCTAQSLESPQASQYLAQLAGRQQSQSDRTLIALAADSLFYDREDRLCDTLKKGLVLDFRVWEDARIYGEALTSLVGALSKTSS